MKLLLDGKDARIAAHEERLTREDATLLIEQLADLCEELETLSLQDADGIVHIYETAWETSLTEYDAAYVGATDATDRVLVTVDSGIHDHAPDAVTVVGVERIVAEQ